MNGRRDAPVFKGAVLGGGLTVDELVRRYCTVVYAQTGSYQETARRLGIDRRTARAKVDRGRSEPRTAGR